MYFQGIVRANFSRSVILLLSLAILASFALHGIFFDHHHPEPIFGGGIFVACHADDRKYFAILLIAFTAALCALRSMIARAVLESRWMGRTTRATTWEEPNPIVRMFSQGILHPKLCA